MADTDDGADVPERTCIVTRAALPPEDMIRFVRGPDGAVVPDLKRKLPGRGAWVSARREAVETAVRKKLFGRALKAEAKADPALPEQVEHLLEAAALQALSLANKAGRVVTGFGKVEAALASGEAAAVLHAREAAADGKRKLAWASPGGKRPATLELFTLEQLSLALGRPHVIHAALLSGPVGAAFLARCDALARYRGASALAGAGTDTDDAFEPTRPAPQEMDAE